MATKTISLSEDAYERLKGMKREGESFSDVVRRLTRGVELREFHGVLSDDTADELESAVAARREAHASNREERERSISNALEDST